MNKRILLYLFLTLLFSNALLSQSENRYWDNGGADTEWITVNNWGNDMLPATNDDVHINNNFNANIASPTALTVESVALGADGDNSGNPELVPPVMFLNTHGNLTIADGATLTLTKGGQEGSDGLHIEGVSGNESVLTVDGTLDINGNSNGDGLDIGQYTSVVVGTTGELDVTADQVNGIKIRDDLTNSGIIKVTASSACDDGIKFSTVVSGGAVITNNSAGTITIEGGGFMGFGINLNSAFTFDNYGSVTVSGTTNNILEGSVTFNNYGTFAGDGIVDAKNFTGGGSGSTITPGIPAIPIGKLTFDNPVDFSDINLDIQINGASSFDQIEIRLLGTIDISSAILNLTGTYTPVTNDVFTIINNTTGSAITGKFNNLPMEGSIIELNGVPLGISYVGGSGNNDVTLTVIPPLPVELISFNGGVKDRSNILKWQTASEVNTMVFIIERSLNGARDFIEMDRVDAIGNSTVLRSYQSEDFNPVDLAYYRLRIVDFDGTFEFSDIIAIERSKSEFDLVEVFPVPAEEEVTVLIRTQSDGKAIMTLSDFLGRKIKEEKIELKSGINRYTLNFGEHETNFYYLTIYNGKERIVKKILRAGKD